MTGCLGLTPANATVLLRSELKMGQRLPSLQGLLDMVPTPRHLLLLPLDARVPSCPNCPPAIVGRDLSPKKRAF